MRIRRLADVVKLTPMLDACTRDDCGHVIGQHGDRAVVACHGDTSRIPGPETYGQPNCRCVGYTTRRVAA